MSNIDLTRIPPAMTVEQTLLLPGAYIAPGVLLEDRVYVGANASILASERETTVIRDGAEIGANAIVYPGVSVGVSARILPGAVVTRSVPPRAIVQGNPARIVGYVDAARGIPNPTSDWKAQPDILVSRVEGVSLLMFRKVPDLRGSLSVGEFEREIPFVPKRYFLVFDVPTAETRGEHAHKACHQLLIAVKGRVHIVADDGANREEFILQQPNVGLYLPPMIWGIQYQYSADAVLLAFASHYYDPEDYIRDYDLFLRLTNQGTRTG